MELDSHESPCCSWLLAPSHNIRFAEPPQMHWLGDILPGCSASAPGRTWCRCERGGRWRKIMSTSCMPIDLIWFGSVWFGGVGFCCCCCCCCCCCSCCCSCSCSCSCLLVTGAAHHWVGGWVRLRALWARQRARCFGLRNGQVQRGCWWWVGWGWWLKGSSSDSQIQVLMGGFT